MASTYHAPGWLPNQHLQTILPALGLPVPKLKYRRQHWDTPDGDIIALDWIDGQKDQPLVVLFHGLEGNSRSHYALRIMSSAKRLGWNGVVVHFRGCGGCHNRKPRSYHGGDTAEIDWVLKRLNAHGFLGIHAVGVSLGGNTLLNWLAEHPMSSMNIIKSACSVSTPFDLAATGDALGRGFNRFYTKIFLKTLKPKALRMIQQFKLNLSAERIASASTLREFDDRFTAPLHGFENVDDYWSKCSSMPRLSRIQMPTLLINAVNDPFLPASCLPDREALPENILLEFPAQGGHVGFANQLFSTGHDWLASRIFEFFMSH